MRHHRPELVADRAGLFKAWELLAGGKTRRALNEAARVLDRHRSLDDGLLAEMERFAEAARAQGSPYEGIVADGLAARARRISARVAVSSAVFVKESGVAGVDAAAAEALLERLRGNGGLQTIARMYCHEFVMQAQAAGIDPDVATALYKRLRTLPQTTLPHPPEPVPVSAKVALWTAATLVAFPFVITPITGVLAGGDSWWAGFFVGWVLWKFFWVFLIVEGVAVLAGIYGLAQSIRLHSRRGVKASLAPLVPGLIVGLLALEVLLSADYPV